MSYIVRDFNFCNESSSNSQPLREKIIFLIFFFITFRCGPNPFLDWDPSLSLDPNQNDLYRDKYFLLFLGVECQCEECVEDQ